MKKLICFIIAVMTTMSVAFAAESPAVGTTVTIQPSVEITDFGDIGKSYVDAIEKDGMPLTSDTVMDLNWYFDGGFLIYDAVALDMTGVADYRNYVINLRFATHYMVGTQVSAVFVISKGNNVYETILEAEVIEEYVIAVKFPYETILLMDGADETFLLIAAGDDIET